jgi:copper chaperone CopZ
MDAETTTQPGMSGSVQTGELTLRKPPGGGAAYRILLALSSAGGVRSAEVRVKDGRIRVEYDPARTTLEALARAIRGAGFRFRPNPKPDEATRLAA